MSPVFRNSKRACLGGLLITFTSCGPGLAAEPERRDFMLGVDANYALDMEAHGSRWKWDGEEQELFAGMEKAGARWLRVRLWTSDEGVNGKDYATAEVERATKAGLNPYLVIFLSENWADLTKQPAPAPWKKLSLEERAEAVRKYSRDIVSHFCAHGLTSHLYEIGNEIDYGICGVFPGKHAKKNPEHLSNRVWPDAAKLILACQRGVKEADPKARFILHIAHWWDADFSTAFFQIHARSTGSNRLCRHHLFSVLEYRKLADLRPIRRRHRSRHFGDPSARDNSRNGISEHGRFSWPICPLAQGSSGLPAHPGGSKTLADGFPEILPRKIRRSPVFFTGVRSGTARECGKPSPSLMWTAMRDLPGRRFGQSKARPSLIDQP